MFGKKIFEISLNRVHDKVRIREGGETLLLYVDDDPMRMVAGMSKAQEALKALNKDSTDEQFKGAAMYFATVIFGKEQAEQLAEFYHGDSGCMVNVCGKYFEGKLSKLITAAQKKIK